MNRFARLLIAPALAGSGAAMLFAASPASATGTAYVKQPDGSEQTYHSVRIQVDPASMTLTSSDGVGTIYIGKASCTTAGALLKCLPYDATYDARGNRMHIALRSGFAWLNPTTKSVSIPDTETRLAPHGVNLSLKSQSGTSLVLIGTADEMAK